MSSKNRRSEGRARAEWAALGRKLRDGLPLLLIAALLSPSLATTTSWNSPSTLIRLPIECSLLCLALFSYRWRVCRPLFWLVAAAVPLGLFCRVFYGSAVTPGALASIEFTNVNESMELLRGYQGYAALAASYLAVVCFGAVSSLWGPNPFTNRRLSYGLFFCLISVPFGAAMWLKAAPPSNYRPMTLASNLKYVMLNESFPWDAAYSEYAILRGRRVIEKAEARRASYVFPGMERLTSYAGPEAYVVVIGESSRRESWRLFGYGRDTNPLLAAIPKDELFLFDQIRSNANITINSLPLALTGTDPAEHWRAVERKSIVGLARQAGFDTYWISAQEMFGGAANPVTSIADEANNVRFIKAAPRRGRGFEADGGAYDEDVLKPLEDALAQDQGNRKKVIFIHTMGSHYEYASRVPVVRAFFDSAGSREGGAKADIRVEKVDAYDDSVLYTDFVIKSVIDIISKLGYPSALLYFSDHGERMYCQASPRESFGHGYLLPAKDELDVPVLLWLSRSYRLRYPALAEAAKANAHLATSLGSVFDTFADLIRVGIKRTWMDKSLLSRSPAPATFDVFGVDERVHKDGLPQQDCGWEHPEKSSTGPAL